MYLSSNTILRNIFGLIKCAFNYVRDLVKESIKRGSLLLLSFTSLFLYTNKNIFQLFPLISPSQQQKLHFPVRYTKQICWKQSTYPAAWLLLELYSHTDPGLQRPPQTADARLESVP